MTFSSLQENFKKGLLIVSRIAGKNVNLPILNNIMLETKDGNIKLITTDLEIGIVCTVRGKVDKEGVYTVDSKILTDYINLLPNKKININKKEDKLKIECENYKTVIRGQVADEYPLIPTIETQQNVSVGTSVFKKALSQVVFAVSTSETRMELTGVLIGFELGKIILAATDSYRLAEKEIEIGENENIKELNGKKIIIPSKTVQELIRILSVVKEENVSGEEKDIKISVSDNQILFSVDGIDLISRLIEGQYPDYKQIIPASLETHSVVNRDELIRAIKAASIFSKTGVNDINLDFPEGKNKIVVSSTSSQAGENITDLEATVNGKDNGIVVNHRYLLDGVNNIQQENIKIEVTNGNTPCVVKGEKEEGYLYIVMPIKQ